MVRKRYRQLGFSLVEAMVGMGLMTAVGVGVMQMQSQQVKSQKNIDADYEVRLLSSAIYNQLKNKKACENTFNGTTLSGSDTELGVIRDDNDVDLFRSTLANGGATPELFKGQTQIEIVRYIAQPSNFIDSEDAITREGSVRIGIEYRKVNNVLNNNNLYTKYLSLPIRAKYTISTGLFSSCITETDDIVQTSVEKFCESLNGDYDDVNSKCILKEPAYPIDPSTIAAHHGISINGFVNGIWPNLIRDTYVRPNTDTLMTGELVSTRNIRLVQDPTLGDHAVPKSYADQRFKCSGGGVGIMTPNGPVCGDLMCNNSPTAQQYMVGINPNGDAICNNLFTSDVECDGKQGRLVAQANGSVKFECCSATCSTPEAYCAGTNYPADNGCGVCQGSKPSTSATWSSWSDTGETREITACVNGQIQTEKKQTRTCTGVSECGGANCSGSNEQWVAGLPITCSTESGWACQPAQTRQESSGSLWGYATNIRMNGMNWKQERPSWPVVVPNGNSWQQGNHAGCIESCRAYAKTQYASDITSVSGEDRMSDSNKTLTIGIIDVFFQEHSGYNQGPPYHDNDNSGFWCGCMMQVHKKGQALAYSDYSMSKSSVDSKIEQATVCTLNGEGGTPIGNPNPPTCSPSKTCAQMKAEVCSDQTIYKQDECGNTCSGSGTKFCSAPPSGGCGARLGQMGSNYACCPDGYNSQGYGYMVEDLGSLDLWYLPNNPPGAFQCMRMYTAP